MSFRILFLYVKSKKNSKNRQMAEYPRLSTAFAKRVRNVIREPEYVEYYIRTTVLIIVSLFLLFLS